jgi:hypothetical protein
MQCALFPVALISLSACAASPLYHPELVLAERPPSFDYIEAQLKAPRCAGSHRQYEITGERAPDGDTAPLETRCYPQMPRLLIDLSIQGACMSMFDLDPAGAPINRVTRCAAGHARYTLSEEWSAFAVRTFSRSVDGMFAQTRYAGAAGRPASERRTNIASIANFGIDGERLVMPTPMPFQREGAPPLPEILLKQLQTER